MGEERRETVAAYLEALKPADDKDARDLEMRLTLLDLVYRLDDKRAIPYLWHLANAKIFVLIEPAIRRDIDAPVRNILPLMVARREPQHLDHAAGGGVVAIGGLVRDADAHGRPSSR